MEIILKKDVEGVGFKDDIVTVKNGFGRNFLIPNGSAILATPSAKKVLAENIRQQAVKDKKVIDDANKLAKKLAVLRLRLRLKLEKVLNCLVLLIILMFKRNLQKMELKQIKNQL